MLHRVRDDLSAGDALFHRPSVLEPASEALAAVDRSLRGPAGLGSLLAAPASMDRIGAVASRIGEQVEGLESALDQDSAKLTPRRQEEINAALIKLKDGWWAIARDRIGMARSVADLISGPDQAKQPNLEAWWSIQVALASLDRLEVRGRDSAGVHLLVAGHGLDLDSPEVRNLISDRAPDPLFMSGSVRTPDGCLSLVYKAAAEIGELGDNVKALRHAIRSDRLLARALESPDARVTVLGHTRWASVGIISEPNAHPLNSEEVGRAGVPYVAAALNGDVDNHLELRSAEGLVFEPEITTDAKVIPAMVSRRLAEGVDMDGAFRATVSRFEGSVAIAASSVAHPDHLQLALCGSGQSLYIGLAEDAYVVASEPYGLVEETDHYVRMDGETTQGQIVTLNRSEAGSLSGMVRARYSGHPLPVEQADVVTAAMTTRDVDRCGFDHFLLKELTEAPASFRKTLRGRIVADSNGHHTVRVGDDSLPSDLAEALSSGRIDRVIVIGQGTAAVAGQAVAAAISWCLPGLSVSATPATELSGFGLTDDMSDTLIVAISQSGTTTDTNRTVDLAAHPGCPHRGRRQPAQQRPGRQGPWRPPHVGWSRRRDERRLHQSLLLAGRGRLASCRGAGPAPAGPAPTEPIRLISTASWPRYASCPGVGGGARPTGADRAHRRRSRPTRRYWAVVGGGPDQIAASEVRIKLSELCYRSISADATEDKKHIDLSCEPLILVCGAGLRGATAGDAAKEVAIYRAHKAAPVVIATEAEAERFRASAHDVITVPETDPALGFVLSAMVGHLFGYEAALSIDAQARPLRAARAAIEKARESAEAAMILEGLRSDLDRAAGPFLSGLRDGSYNGNLEAATAVRLVSLLRYATGTLPLEAYESETGKIGTPESLLSDLLGALNAAIDELTRPIDAIKHQAKTVTVGISRSEDELFGVPLVKATLAAGAAPDRLGLPGFADLGRLERRRGRGSGVHPIPDRLGERRGDQPSFVVDQGGVARGHTVANGDEIRVCGGPSTGLQRSGRSRWPRGAATAARSSWFLRPRAIR